MSLYDLRQGKFSKSGRRRRRKKQNRRRRKGEKEIMYSGLEKKLLLSFLFSYPPWDAERLPKFFFLEKLFLGETVASSSSNYYI